MPQTQVRVAGSGFTTFNYQGQPIAFLDGFIDSGQNPIVGPQGIIPLDKRHAVEIATSRVLDLGTLTVQIRELWNGPVWQQLQGLADTWDLVDVYEALARNPADVTCQMIVKPPGSPTWRGKVYHGCVVTNIDEGENVQINTVTVPRSIQISYTHTTPLRQNAG